MSKLDEIHDEWGKDARIDETELGRASLDIPLLHHKWLRKLSEEKLKFKRIAAALDGLRARKMVFYTQGPNEESRAAGWKFPAQGKILKSEVKQWVEADRDVVEMGLQLAEQSEVVDAVESILKSINNRNFIISNAINWNKFINGQ